MDVRNPNPGELADIIARVSSAFSYKEGDGDVARDFPLFYDSSNLSHLWAAFIDGKIAGHAGFFPAVMRVENLSLPVAGIGGVYTEADQQGQGLGSLLINKCAEEAAKGGAALAFLWSDKHDFYAKLGFHLTGRQWTAQLEPKHSAALDALGDKAGILKQSLTFREDGNNPIFLRQSHDLLDAYPIGIARTPDEHARYLGGGAARVFSAWAGNELAAYFVMGKGRDLTDCVHEWAGDEGALHHLAAHCLETLQRPFLLFSPQFMPDEVNWIYALNDIGVPLRPDVMGLVKILDFAKVKRLVGEYLAKAGLQPDELQLGQSGEGYTVEWRGKAKLSFTEPQILRFLFGPDLPVNQELRAFFPLRLWYWGMDSV